VHCFLGCWKYIVSWLCLTNWQLQVSTMLTYFANCMSQLIHPSITFISGNSSAHIKDMYTDTSEAPRKDDSGTLTFAWQCMLTGHMFDKLLSLSVDLKKCTIQHIHLSLHQVITTCFQIYKTPSWTENFDRWWAQVRTYFTGIEELQDHYKLSTDKGGNYIKI